MTELRLDLASEQQKLYFILAYSFIAGFSERFTKDIISKVSQDDKRETPES
jgi:hypothetical protein